MKNTHKHILYTSIGLLLGIGLGVGISAKLFSPNMNKYYTDISTRVGNSMSHGSHGSNAHTNSMASMMHDMNKALEGKTGDAFDQAFLSEMIVHHQGAVEMAQKVLEVSKRPELIKLANDIITAQNKEIEMMKGWQSAWGK